MPAVVTERTWSVLVSHSALGARAARHRLADELADVVRPALLADVVAVLAELVGNAVRHADPLPGDVVRVAWRVRGEVEADAVEVRVTDGGSAAVPRVRTVGPDSIGGRGLSIVAALSRRWGVERGSRGQSVWAEVCRPG
ncbi:MAG TPA: ATP-binding protein [Micromonospora sp.]|nr:ATP-binding protein [Micromonospora sp.]